MWLALFGIIWFAGCLYTLRLMETIGMINIDTDNMGQLVITCCIVCAFWPWCLFCITVFSWGD